MPEAKTRWSKNTFDIRQGREARPCTSSVGNSFLAPCHKQYRSEAGRRSHGAQKLFGWFGGYGLKGTGGFFEAQLGFRPGVPFAAAAGLSEMGGGILLTLGLLTPFGSAAVLSAMLVAIVSVHVKNGFFAMANGFELPFLYAASAVGLAFSGPGGYSFDSWLGLTFLNEGYLVEAILVLAVLGAAATLASRRQVEEQASAVRN